MIYNIEEELEKNPYHVTSEVSKLFGLKKTKKGYCGLFHKGLFDELHDYDTGILWVSIYTSFFDKKYSVRFYIGNVDDGDWGAWSKNKSKEECDKTVEKLYTCLEHVHTLLTESDLNKILNTCGLHGLYEG